jgi:hypothetical protein
MTKAVATATIAIIIIMMMMIFLQVVEFSETLPTIE